ncbi:putative beta-1,4-xylosyltransferase IRX10-like [Hibiscus syriacus]|uniref:Beta-1,4-xylosyltransferase IRX10-like n=1 Tax=Hibiscus syriacus TaxID=106335 RepID=A0A6A2Y812_HIBSY|nr:putative beta-1,4-xylosyltransferase IRX10-like [Hibiscus syriacus]
MEFKDCDNEGQEEEQKEAIGEEVERSKIGIMRALAEREDPSAKDADGFMIRRFLRAGDLDIEKANTMFLKYLSWRRTFLPEGFISELEISTQLADNKLCMQGVDKQGRPIVVAFGGMPKGQEKFVAIGDLEGWGYSNSDIRAYLASLSILQV